MLTIELNLLAVLKTGGILAYLSKNNLLKSNDISDLPPYEIVTYSFEQVDIVFDNGCALIYENSDSKASILSKGLDYEATFSFLNSCKIGND